MSVRGNKGPRKDGPHGQVSPTQPRRGGGPGAGGAWRGPHNNPSIMQNFTPRTPPQATSPSLAPVGSANASSATPDNNAAVPDGQANKTNISPPPVTPALPPNSLIGSVIVVTTHSGGLQEGTLVQNNQPIPGIALKDAKDLVNPGAPLNTNYFIPAQQIAHWRKPDPAPAPATNGNKALDTFRTDRDISAAGGVRERELQAWQPDGPAGPSDHLNRSDALTFGNVRTNGDWDQFAANEKLFGLTSDYQEEIYTTKLDRSTSDYRDRERKAQQLADEITSSTVANPHIREERGLDDGGANEEDKYGAVVRGPNAYVPPGARRTGDASGVQAKSAGATTPASSVPKLSVNGAEAPANANSVAAPAQTNGGSHANGTEVTPTTSAPGSSKHEDPGVIASFRDFVSNEKQKLAQKKQAIAKNEMDKRLADLVKFSSSFKLNKPVPSDLVPILAKDSDKQKAILEKSIQDSQDKKARSIGTAIPPATGTLPIPNATNVAPALVSTTSATGTPSAPAAKPPIRLSAIQEIPPFKGGSKATQASAGKPAATASADATKAPAAPAKAGSGPKRVPMVIPKIPPFDPNKRRTTNEGTSNASTPATNGTTTTPASPTTSQSKLNVNATSFKPNPNVSSFKPGTSPTPSASASASTPASVKPAEGTVTPNPYFGVRSIKKDGTVHIKDDFNPFKYSKVADATTVPATWPFSGKRFSMMFPPLPHPPPSAAPAPPHVPAPQPYEEDPQAQQQAAQARAAQMAGYMYYNPYPYPGQPPQPQMMAPPNAVPPAGYMPSPYMQPMPYPQGVQPNGAPMYPSMMQGMPPGAYMPPPPQGYQPNGGPRGSMPPTPMPQHAYSAYHQSPQMQHQHALPYGMMMPPPAPGVPHNYDAQQQGPGAMGVGH